MTRVTAPLKRAYAASGLSLLGISFERALEITAIRISLESAVKAANRRAAKTTQPVPAQLFLI